MNRDKIIAILAAASVTIFAFTGCGALNSGSDPVKTATGEMDAVVQTMEGANLLKHSDTAGKEETVYVLMDADGNRKDTIVSAWVKNPDGAETLKDRTTLTELEVVKGGATFTKGEKDQVTWTTGGEDVYYQGRTDAALPVDVKIAYELDGTTVAAAELSHVTGHLKVTCDYENHASKKVEIKGKSCTIYQPFTMISGSLFDNGHAQNITVTNGKCINSGDYTFVFGVALPGLSDSLGLDEKSEIDVDVEIPESVVIEADVSDFSMPMTITAASNQGMDEWLDTEDLSIDELADKADALADGMSKLMDGTGDLTDGIEALMDGTDVLRDGTLDLFDGAGALNDGAQSLKEGAVAIKDGAKALAEGADQVNTGTGQLKDGISQVDAGAIALRDNLAKLNEKAPALAAGVDQLAGGAGQLSKGLKTITDNNEALTEGAKSLAGGLKTLDQQLSSDESAASINALVQGSAQYEAGMQQLMAGYSQLDESSAKALADALQAYARTLPDEQASVKYTLESSAAMLVGYTQFASSANDAAGSYSSIDAGIQEFAGSVQKAAAGVSQLAEGAESLSEGVEGYTAGVSEASKGAASLKEGVDTMKESMPELTSGVKQLSDGAASLATGTGKLKTGARDLNKGTASLADGAGQLFTGSKTLSSGAKSLADGTKALADGTGELKDGTVKLSDGVSALLDGSIQLKDGVKEFNDEGISKITDLVTNDLERYYDRWCAICDYAATYTTFAGADSGVEGTVTFIYRTEAVE